jgi:hypothetical protein
MRNLHSYVLAGAVALVSTAGTAVATPFDPVGLLATIAIPASAQNNQSGNFTAFDISFVDPTTGLDYVADRSNAAVDVFGGVSFLGRTPGLTGGVQTFTGQQATTSISGPDGVLVTSGGGNHKLFAGDGGSTLRAFGLTGGGLPTAQTFSTNTGGGAFRVDEMAYSPSTNLAMVANNANSPAFASLINATTGAIVKGNITIPGAQASDGLEQSVWNPNTGTFFVSVPAIAGSAPGGVAEIDTTGKVLHVYNFGTLSGGAITSCSPTGLALGASGNLMAGCGNAGSQTVVLNPTANGGNGAIVTTLSAVSGSDELWYDAADGNFYVTGVDPSGNRVVGIFADGTYALLQSVNLTALGADHVNAHSIAVNPFSGDVYVPLEGTTSAGVNTLCPSGCIAVFAPIPEPTSIGLFSIAVLGFFACVRWRGGFRVRQHPGKPSLS